MSTATKNLLADLTKIREAQPTSVVKIMREEEAIRKEMDILRQKQNRLNERINAMRKKRRPYITDLVERLNNDLDAISGKVKARVKGAWVEVYIHEIRADSYTEYDYERRTHIRRERLNFRVHMTTTNGNPFQRGEDLEIDHMDRHVRAWLREHIDHVKAEHKIK